MSNHNLTIAATAYNRPDRLARLLASIAAADEAQRWAVVISVEPSPQQPAILAVLANYAGRLNLHHRTNAERGGVRRNPHDNIEWALALGAQTVLLLEDDLTIDRQALRWCAQLAEDALMAPEVMCANLLMTTCNSESIFVPADAERASLANIVVRTRFFSSYGLLFTRAQWARHFAGNWFVDEPVMENWAGELAFGWDVAMNRLLLADPTLCVLQSVVPRVLHEGRDGTHVTAAFQSRSFDNVQLGGDEALGALKVVDPLTGLAQIPSPCARMYLNLARHLWTLQAQAIAHKQLYAHVAGLRHWTVRIGAYLYLIFRKRASDTRR